MLTEGCLSLSETPDSPLNLATALGPGQWSRSWVHRELSHVLIPTSDPDQRLISDIS